MLWVPYGITAGISFVDFINTYDSFRRSGLLRAMVELHVPQKLIRLVNMTLEDTVSNIRAKKKTSLDFHIREGIRQGEPLSTLLLNILFEMINRDSLVRDGRDGLIFHTGSMVCR